MLHVGDFGLDWPGLKRGHYEDKLNKQAVQRLDTRIDRTVIRSG